MAFTLYNADHVANSQKYLDGYDMISWDRGEYKDTAEEREEEEEGNQLKRTG